jgi:geranylgeranyl diphosphate synthase type II
MFDIDHYIQAQNAIINRALSDTLERQPDPDRLVAAMEYSLLAGGKRIRPVLCLAAAEAVGGKSEDALPAACALEMIHTYSLIHDDLPAMDDDDLRRGKPTSHVAFDEATAILAGDALLTLAFQILSAAGPSAAGRLKTAEQAFRRLEVIQCISIAAGYRGMIQGQMLDMTAEGRVLSLDELASMHALKTGALIEASLYCGAVMGGGSDRQIELIRTYAENIGLAFQVTDDILNVEGDPKVMGKAVGTDTLRRKSTYPSVLGLEKSKQFAQNLVNKALRAIESFDNKSDPLRAIAAYIINRKK